MQKLRFAQRAGMVVLGIVAPHRLARLMLRPYVAPPGVQDEWPGQVEDVAFPSAGGALCRGWLVTPAGAATDAGVVLTHGWGSHALRMQMWVPVLLLHGTLDEVIPPSHFDRLRRAAGPNVSAVLFPDLDHHTIRVDQGVQARVIDFLTRVLPSGARSPSPALSTYSLGEL